MGLPVVSSMFWYKFQIRSSYHHWVPVTMVGSLVATGYNSRQEKETRLKEYDEIGPWIFLFTCKFSMTLESLDKYFS